MKKYKKNLLKNTLLVSLSTLSFASVITPIINKGIANKANNNNLSANSDRSISTWKGLSTNFLSRKNTIQSTSSSKGYLQFSGTNIIEYYNFEGQKQWTYNIYSDDKITFDNGESFSMGSYANPILDSNNISANQDAFILDAVFNEDSSKVVVLSGYYDSVDGNGEVLPGYTNTEYSDGSLKTSIFQIDLLTGKPYINNNSTCSPVYNSAYYTSQNSGVTPRFLTKSTWYYPFLAISNNKATIIYQSGTQWINTKKIDLTTYFASDYKFEVSDTIARYRPFAFSSLNSNENVLVLASSSDLYAVKTDKDLVIASNATAVKINQNPSNSLDIASSDLGVYPSIMPNKDGSKFFMYFYTKGPGNGNHQITGYENNIVGFNSSDFSTASSKSLGSTANEKINNLNWRKETNTIVASNSGDFFVFDMSDSSLNNKASNVSFGDGVTLSDADLNNAWFRVIDADFTNAAGFVNGSGGTIRINNKNYWLKISSDFSTIKIENIISNTLKDSNALFQNLEQRKKLASVLTLDDVAPVIGFTDQEGGTADEEGKNKYSLLMDNGVQVNSPSQPIASYYNSAVSGDGTQLSFKYIITKASWWNSNDKVIFSNNEVTLTGISKSTDYYVRENSNGSWNNGDKQYLPSKVQLKTVLNNIVLGDGNKSAYPIKTLSSYGNNEAQWLAQNSKYFVDITTDYTVDNVPNSGIFFESTIADAYDANYTFPSGKYIKLFANDNDGSLIVKYDFSNFPGGFFDEAKSNLPILAIKGEITIYGFQTNESYEVFYTNNDSVKTLLNTNYSFNINKDLAIDSLIPRTLSPGYVNPWDNPNSNNWNYINILSGSASDWASTKPFSGSDVTLLDCAWNNWMSGIIEYTGNMGVDTTTSTTRRIFILPVNPTIQGQSPSDVVPEGANYEITIKGQSYSGKTYDSATKSGDLFINSKKILENQSTMSIGKTISNLKSGETFSPEKAFEENTEKGATVPEVIRENIASTDIVAAAAGDVAAKTRIKKTIFEFTPEVGGKLSNPSIKINNNWIPLNSIDLKLEYVGEDTYYFTYKMNIIIKDTSVTNIPYGNNFLTIGQLGLGKAGSNSVFDDVSYLKDIEIKVLNEDKVYAELQLQENLSKQNASIKRDNNAFKSTVELNQISSKFMEENYDISATTKIDELNNKYKSITDKEQLANTINNDFTFLNSDKKYPVTNAVSDPNNLFKFNSVRLISDDYNGSVLITFEISFYDPEVKDKLLSDNIGRKVIVLEITGFYSYKYELIMWSIFATILFIVVLSIALLLIHLHKETKKNRLWNIKKKG